MKVLVIFALTMASSMWKRAFVRAWTTKFPSSFRRENSVALRSYIRYSGDDLSRLSAHGNDTGSEETEFKTVTLEENPEPMNGKSEFQGDDTEFKPILMTENETLQNATLPLEFTASVLGVNPEHVDIVSRNHSRRETKSPALSFSDMFQSSQFVELFRGSANYIANHRNNLVVFHIPGDWVDHENPKIFRDLMNDIALTWLLGLKIVIVVGCRYQIEKRMGEENREKHMGMIVTDQESLRIVKEEAGYVRFEVERQLARSLQGSRGRAGDGNVVSGNFYSAQPFGILDGIDYKYSGFVRRLEKEKINQCHENRDIVLLTTLGVSPTGEVFNVNSEYLAAYAGGALDASKVIYFLEKDVELQHKVHGTRIPHMRVTDSRKLLERNDISTEKKGFVFVGEKCPYDDEERSMLVKIGWSMHALEKGVKRVHIISPENGSLLQELYTRDGAGTLISGDLYDGIRQAGLTDVTGIYELITPLIQQGTLVDRPRALLEQKFDEYHVYTRDDLIVATGQLKLFEDGYAEIGCLVVNPAYRARGRGDAMLGYLERLSVKQGANVIFVLSTQTMEWFLERGFAEVTVDMLPPSRQATYNRNRASKIYMKRITSIRELDAAELFWDT